MWDCSHNVKWKDSVAGYLIHGLANTYKLKKRLEDGTYKISEYTKFTVHEPKERKIESSRFVDRQFQRSLTEHYAYDAITKSFIYDSHACQIEKGTDTARDRVAAHMRKFYRKYGLSGYTGHGDLHNFFGSTGHDLAKNVVAKRVTDSWCQNRINEVPDSYDGDIGIGLGSQITQLIQLAVLDDMDHIIKERLGIKHYVRYMDDFILIHEDAAYIQYCLQAIEEHIESIGLELNSRKTYVAPLSTKFKWLGFDYRLTDTGKVLRTLPKDKIAHERRKLKRQVKLAKSGKMERDQVQECFKAWAAHAGKGNNYYTIQKMEKYLETLWKESDNA